MVDASNFNSVVVAVALPTDMEEELPRHNNEKESDSDQIVIAVIGEGTEKEKLTRKGLYYAVRVGYTIISSLLVESDNNVDSNCDDDIHPNKKRKCDKSSTSAAAA